MEKKIGHYSFIVGVVIAFVLGLASAAIDAGTAALLTSLLVVLGLVVGFLNVSGKETKEFLIVAALLVVISSLGGASQNLGGVVYIGEYLSSIFTNLLAFVVPATIVVALKDISALAQNQ